MPFSLFNPFETLYFNPETCFLTGEDLPPEDEQMCIFPAWILDRFSLRNKKFKMMDQVTGIHYEDLKLPCSPAVKNALDILDEEIKEAFIEGYEAVKKIPEERLFLWMGKMVYGVLYHDLNLEIRRSAKNPKLKEFKLSPLLKERFGKFHLMLQSLMVSMEFKGIKPWSIEVVKLKYSQDTFNYKDEPTNLNFSLGMNGFGIVACLQDNGAVGQKQQDILEKISDKILHPIQFEELCARFLYSNYLLKKRPAHIIEVKDEKVIIESLLITETLSEPVFGNWDDNMFARVLAEYWEPWGITKNEIITPPDSPISFLENDYTHEFIEPESVKLPF
ncbi:MAG TPA: hypothetical protein VLI68_15000 [Hanamia sp.]|jgi:hypothetical protein|nr:hypothetical protein [Hanamia sp.]